MALAVAFVFIVLYLLPALVASSRSHHNSGAIFALNLLLGWTVIGWIVAFVWACTATRPAEVARATPTAPPSSMTRYCTHCGSPTASDARFCARCGMATAASEQKAA